jgi:hypothetical protein
MTSLHFREGVMIAVDTLNLQGNHIAARKLLATIEATEPESQPN